MTIGRWQIFDASIGYLLTKLAKPLVNAIGIAENILCIEIFHLLAGRSPNIYVRHALHFV
jgi:hypothetical protein